MGKATYQFNKPFLFMEKGYSDSLSLVMAFLEHWDVAISVFRRGDMQSFWTEFVSDGEPGNADFFAEAYNTMWKDVGKEDVLFQKVIHYIEPNLEGMPLIPAGERTATLYSHAEVADWLEALIADKEENLVPERIPETFDEESYHLLWLDAAIKEGVFSAYNPGLEKQKNRYSQTTADKDKILQCKQIIAKLREQVPFIFDGQIYTSLRDLYFDKLREKTLTEYHYFLGTLFQSSDSRSELEEWSEEAPQEEREAFRKLKAAWDKFHGLMTKRYGANWYENHKLYKPYIFELKERSLDFDICTQQQKEECMVGGISDAEFELEDTQARRAFYQVQKDLYTVSLGGEMLFHVISLNDIERRIDESTAVIHDCEEQIKACGNLLPVVKNQDYAAFCNQAADGMERRMMFRFAIWPTFTMEEDYFEKFFGAWEQFLQQKEKEGKISDELKYDVSECFLTLYKLVEVLGEKNVEDKRMVAGIPISHYYIKKLDRIGKLSEKFLDSNIYAEQQKMLCALYGEMVGQPIKDTFDLLRKQSQKLVDMHNKEALNDAYYWDKKFAGLDKGAYEKWKNVYDEYKDKRDNFWKLVMEEIKIDNLDKLVNSSIPKDVEPWGIIVENKDKHVKAVQEDLDSWKRLYETTKEELLKVKAKYGECFKPLKAAWDKAEEKRKKLEAEEKEKQKQKEEKNARIRAWETEKAKKAKEKSLKRIKKRDAAKERKRKCKEVVSNIIVTLKNIILFPFKVLLFPFVIMKNSAFLGIFSMIIYVAAISFIYRYATPTYYGTGFYLGNKLGYTHYKVADGVTVIEDKAFAGAKRMKTIELPESLEQIQIESFANCSSLEEITFPSSVIYFGNNAFTRCQSLKKVKINAYEYELAGQVFDYCVSLTDIETVDKMPVEVLNANTNGCRNLEREEMLAYGCGYGEVPKDFTLLENEVQLKNAMDTGYSYDGNSIVTVFFDPKTDKLTNIQIGEEQKTEAGRCVTVTFTLQKDFIEQDFVGTLTTNSSEDGWESINKSFECLGQRLCKDKVELMQRQFAEGNYSELEAILGKYDFRVGEESIPFGEGQVIVEQAQIVPLFATEANEAGETIMPENPAYRIAIKAFVDKNLNDYTFMGNILLSEKYNYSPQIITNMSEWNGLDLLGTYEYTNEDGVHKFTIDSQYDNIYTVTDNSRHSNVTYIKEEAAVNQKRLLVLNDDGKSGKMVSANNVGDYSVWDVEINAYKDGLELKSTGSLYKKVSDEVTPPDEAFNNPLVGVWEGTYDTSRSHVASRRYIFPAGGENLTVISKFGPTEQTPDFRSGATVDVLLWKEEYNNGIIESRAWVHQPQGYNFVIFEGNLDESGTTISGGGEYPFTMTKTEAHNEKYGYGTNNGEGWSIYDGNGNPWPALFAVSDAVPTDALQFGESYYMFYTNASSWEEARDKCEDWGGHLAIIDSAEENAFLHSYFVKYGYERCYFGLADAAEEGNWTWIDGTSVMNRYSNFNSAQPDADTVYEDYAEFWNKYSDGTWNDCKFYEGAGFICEWDGLIFETTGQAVEESVTEAEPEVQATNISLENVPEHAAMWNNHYYAWFNNCSSWDEAKTYCESLGGHLAVINSTEEDNAVYRYLCDQGYKDGYIGVSDAAEEGKWLDVFGQSPSYTNWHSGEPNNETSSEDYAMYYKKFTDGTWNDAPFGSGSIFICEWE